MSRHVIIAVLIGATVTVPLGAHHSFAAEFDENKTVNLKGTLTKMEWANPHIWLYLDVKSDDGPVLHWQCEGGAPNTLVRHGWNRSSLKPGDQVIIEGYLAKDSSKTCNAKKVTLPDGRSVFAGSSAPSAQE